MTAMTSLSKELAGTDLANLDAFNKTYYVITKNVVSTLETGHFADDETMVRFDIRFAEYYFEALARYLEGDHITHAWQRLFDACRNDTLYQFQFMALGVNAHVNHDIPLALKDITPTKTYKSDFNKVNAIITYSIEEVVTGLKETSSMLDKAENELRFLYAKVLEQLIARWREDAWNSYQGLLDGSVAPEDLAQRAGQIADELAASKSVSHIARFVGREYGLPLA